jgi:ferric-dicitrate binding protein FerR (iron transport regulator)
MENKMQIEKLIKKFYLGTLTNEELTFLLNYLTDQEPQHEVLVFYQNIWDKAEEYNSDIDSKRIFNQIVKTIGVSEGGRLPATGSLKKVVFRDYVRLVMRYAAVFILAFGLSWLVHLYFWNRTTTTPIADQVQTMEVPYGSKSRIILPDGSVVTLNSGSSLKYSSSGFNSGSRSVSLTGEGFFNVAKDSTRPFYMTTPGIRVKVLGTTFNVKAYPDENIEEATLVSGMVEIYASSDKTEKGKPIVLKPNQKAVFLKSGNNFLTNDSVMVSPVTTPVKLKTVNLQSSSRTEQTISWKENKLIFDNEPFSSLVIRIERWYDVKIVVNYPELNSARFTGKFDKETLEQVLNALVTVTPFNYNIKQNLITISKN